MSLLPNNEKRCSQGDVAWFKHFGVKIPAVKLNSLATMNEKVVRAPAPPSDQPSNNAPSPPLVKGDLMYC